MFVLCNIDISCHTTKHIYIVINSESLEIINSPLDKYSSLKAKAIMCAKGACDYAPQIGGTLGIKLGIDQVLKDSNRKAFDSNRKAFFGPLIAQGFNKV